MDSLGDQPEDEVNNVVGHRYESPKLEWRPKQFKRPLEQTFGVSNFFTMTESRHRDLEFLKWANPFRAEALCSRSFI